MLCFLFRTYQEKKLSTLRVPGVCTYVHACGVWAVFLNRAWSSWHLQVASLHLSFWAVCSVPSFLVSERSGQNRPVREDRVRTYLGRPRVFGTSVCVIRTHIYSCTISNSSLDMTAYHVVGLLFKRFPPTTAVSWLASASSPRSEAILESTTFTRTQGLWGAGRGCSPTRSSRPCL